MQSSKRLKKSFSEEGITEKATSVVSGATPIFDPNMEAPTDTESVHSMLHTILGKVSGLDNLYKQVDSIAEKLNNIETKMNEMEIRLVDVENGMDSMETDIEELKVQVSEIRKEKADVAYANELKEAIVDLVNRNKRNNVVLHGVPEGEEGDTHDCVDYVGTFFSTHLQAPNVEIERAHRTPMGKRKHQSQERPRPIHVKLLRFTDREKLLRGSAALKDVRIRGNRVGISDDIHKETRA